MQPAGLQYLANWLNFYIIMGTAAATLTGLMFIVVTLLVGRRVQTSTVDAGVSAFNTPTVVHFCAVLLTAGILSAPWPEFSNLGIILALVGLGGVVYLIVVIQRMRHVPGYATPWKDWLWYVALPLVMYAVLIGAGVALRVRPEAALYVISAAMTALLFISIHNAWDLVTYLALERTHVESDSDNQGTAPERAGSDSKAGLGEKQVPRSARSEGRDTAE